MEQRLNCIIVQDLLPNYIEGLTSDVTNKAIENHLATCNDCRKALDNMTRETKGINVVPPKQINFLKKIKRRQWKVASISVLISVVILLGAYYLFGSRDFPVSSRDVTISDVYQMNDGSIHYRISANVKGYVSRVSSHSRDTSSTTRIYEHRRLNTDQYVGNVAIPEKWTSVHEPNLSKEITSLYYEGNNKNDRLIIWEKGMNIPKANAEQEANYKNNLKK